MKPFRFAVQVTQLPWDGWRERVRWYEQLGFSAIHCPDHFTMRQWDPLVLQAAVAAMTTQAAVGTTVLDLGFHHPMVLARAAATLAPIAAGGCELGIGAGWMPDDYIQAGLPFDRAGARIEHLDEACRIVLSLWRQERTSFQGEHYHITDAPSVLELPLRVAPKLLVGGTMPKAIAVAGRYADIVSVFAALPAGVIGWPGWAQGSTIERFAEKTRWARDAAVAAGRNADDLEFSTQLLHTAVASDPAPLQAFIAKATGVTPAEQDASLIFLGGTPAQARDALVKRREVTGISYYVVSDPASNYANPEGPPPLAGAGGPDHYFESFAESVISRLSGR